MSSNPASTEIPPRAPPRKTTFFCDFEKKTCGFWDKSNYSLGRQFEISTSPINDSSVKIKVKDGGRLSTNVRAEFHTSWGSVEVEEHSSSGSTVRFSVDRVFRKWNLRTRHRTDEVEVTADCRPEGSFWSAEVGGRYIPDDDGERVCTAEGSISVQDNQYNLAVGGKLELEDRRAENKFFQLEKLTKTYSMGFLYFPSENTQYSLIYKPDKESNGITYDFSLFKKVSDNLSLGARAEGKADLRIVSPPVVSLGASWTNNENFVRGFLNSQKEYGASYQVKVTPNVHVTLGLASFLTNEDLETTIGYKLALF